jgi:hypothetical protein
MGEPFFRGSARDIELSQAYVYTACRRVEIAAAEDAVASARKNVAGGSSYPEVTIVLLEDLVEKYETLVGLLQGTS